VFKLRQDFDIVITNAGGPPPGDFRQWDRDTWIKAVDANMLTPIELIKATVDGMAARGFGRIVNITSAAVKAPIDILGLSNGARSGLTGFVAGVARKTVEHNVTINNLLPGQFDTDRLRKTAETTAKSLGKTADEVAAVRAFRGERARLNECEAFFLAVADVPRAKARAAALAMQLSFDARAREVRARTAALAGACATVRASARLRRVLEPCSQARIPHMQVVHEDTVLAEEAVQLLKEFIRVEVGRALVTRVEDVDEDRVEGLPSILVLCRHPADPRERILGDDAHARRVQAQV
jgi:NAD(P)-dependent dehydrogenase (short-subunit alcohol dehydrogenase family)